VTGRRSFGDPPRERAFTLLRQAGRDDEAAIVALTSASGNSGTSRTMRQPGAGWPGAARAAERTTDTVVRGWLVLIGAYLSPDAGQQRHGLEEARSLAVEAADDGLSAMALADLWPLLVAGGEVDDGMTLLDEAMGPRWVRTTAGWRWRSGRAATCSPCSLVYDLGRARQWCRVVDEFTQTDC
jgi:hypothetical protein